MPRTFRKCPRRLLSACKGTARRKKLTGDRKRAEDWFKKYAVMPPELAAALAKGSDIPVDLDPDFDFHPAVR